MWTMWKQQQHCGAQVPRRALPQTIAQPETRHGKVGAPPLDPQPLPGARQGQRKISAGVC